MASYLDYAGHNGEQPDRWPNLREAASKPWMGQTAVVARRPWLVVGYDGEMYELENERGERMRTNKFEVLDYESDNNRLVAATRVKGSPLDAGYRLAACDCNIGVLDFDRDNYEWSSLTDEGNVIDIEARVAELEDADWQVAATLKEAEIPLGDYDSLPDLHEHEFYCPHCGSADTDTGDGVAYCNDCGWHGSPDELSTEHDQQVDPYEYAERNLRGGSVEDDWQFESAEDDYSGIDDPGHPKHMKGAPDKVSEIYNACMREGNGRGDTKEEQKSSCAAIAWSTYKKEKKTHDEERAEALQGRVGKIVREGDKYCVKSEDGTKNLGCSDTMEGAKKRLQQVEYFKHQGNLAKMDVFGDDYQGEGTSDRKDNLNKPLKCPNCQSHTVEMTNSEKSEFHCKSCGNTFKHDVIKNPKAPNDKKGSTLKEAVDPGRGDSASNPLYISVVPAPTPEPGTLRPGVGAPNTDAIRAVNPSALYTSTKEGNIEIQDTDGNIITSGQYYNLRGDNYKIPDVIKVMEIRDGTIVATVDNSPNPLKISAEDITSQGYSFEKLPIYSNIEQHDWREAASWQDVKDEAKMQLGLGDEQWPARGIRNIDPVPKENPMSTEAAEFTLPTPSGGTLWVRADNHGRVTGWSVPSEIDGSPGKYSDRDLDRVQAMVDQATIQNRMSKTARRSFSPDEQKKLIEEKGSARNKDKLRLDDSHYTESHVEDDIDFLF